MAHMGPKPMAALSLVVLVVPTAVAALAAESKAAATAKPAAATETFDKTALQALVWRNIGPFRGGRSVAVTGVAKEPRVFYFGGTGGGIWKTTDGGVSWKPVADGQLGTGSVGAIAVAASDPNVGYAGMGAAEI